MFTSLARVICATALAVSVLAAPDVLGPTHTARDLFAPSNPQDIVARSLAQSPAVHLTNAQRLARGLPPNRPRVHHRRRALRARQSSTCTTTTGYIAVNSPTNPSGASGYISRTANPYGEYSFTTDPTQALSISYCLDASTEYFEIQTLNGLADFTVFGGVVGFASTNDDLSSSNANYVYIAGTSSVARGPAQQAPNAYSAAVGTPADIESVIWSFSSTGSYELAPSWVNTDNSLPGVTILYVPSSDGFVLTGNSDDFIAEFGAAYPATLTITQNTVA